MDNTGKEIEEHLFFFFGGKVAILCPLNIEKNVFKRAHLNSCVKYSLDGA